nr:FlhC family transcriptional regulator [Azoarcus taiwanensis]
MPSIKTLRRLERLVQLGARPPVIRSLVPTLHDSVISDAWSEHHGRRAPRGPLPHNVGFFLVSPKRRLQASFILAVFDDLRRLGVADAEALIVTYEQFLATFDDDSSPVDSRLTFDRAWFLIREYTTVRSLLLVRCDACGSRHIHRAFELINHGQCPACGLVEAARNECLPESSEPDSDCSKIELPDLPALGAGFSPGWGELSPEIVDKRWVS